MSFSFVTLFEISPYQHLAAIRQNRTGLPWVCTGAGRQGQGYNLGLSRGHTHAPIPFDLSFFGPLVPLILCPVPFLLSVIMLTLWELDSCAFHMPEMGLCREDG